MNKLTNHQIKLKESGLASNRPNLLSLKKDKNNLTGFPRANLVDLDAENNNTIQSPKCKRICNQKVINNDKIPVINKPSLQNGSCLENVGAKIEITEHQLNLENIQTLEGIHKDYNEISALGTPVPKARSNSIGNNYIEKIEVNNKIFSRKSIREKKSVDQLTLSENFVRPKKRKYVDRRKPPKRYEGLERNEKLFIRLVKLDISAKLNELKDDIDDSIAINESNKPCQIEGSEKNISPFLKHNLVPKLEKPTKKVSKAEVQKQNLLNINKTESLKMEQILLQKFRKAKERQGTQASSKEASEISGNEIEPYVYEKTTKSVYETYELTEEENGQIVLSCLLCPFTGERFKQMSLHFKFKHKETPIEEMHFCNVKDCNFKTVHKGMFKWHMRRHMLAADKLISNLYPCGQCDKIFDQRKGFLIHLKHMHKDPASPPKQTDFPCATCKFRTTTKQNLQAHIYRSHVPHDKKPGIRCNVCGYETHYRDDLKKHLIRVHLKG